MRRQASLAGLLVIVAAPLWAGCALLRRGEDRPSPEQVERRQALSREAQAAIDRQDYDAALGWLGQLLVEAPTSAEAHHRLGRVYQALGRPAEAEAAFRRALELDKDYADARIGLGEVRLTTGRYQEAIESLDAAVDLDPKRPEAHAARGRALEGLGRVDDALAAYFRALELDPASVPTLKQVAALQLARDQPDQALARLAMVLDRSPDDAEARFRRGQACLALKRVPEAIDDLQFAAGALPDRPDIHYVLALALESSQRKGDALRAAERALALDPAAGPVRELAEKLRR